MEKNEILNRTKSLITVQDLANLLNDIKLNEFGSLKHAITDKQLLHFSNANIVSNRYKTFVIKKKSGGVREINAPCYQLGLILYLLNILLKAIYTPKLSAMGFTVGRSVVDNAKVHVGHNYVFNIDLKDFFPSIPQSRVWGRLQYPPFNFNQKIANIVAGLCCHFNIDKSKCVLPQGAATSPLLTNAICDNLDRKMRGVAKRFGLHYTRYADDMTFSSMHNVYQENSEFRTEILRIIKEERFTINDKKTRLQKEGERQDVTGLTVNYIVNVSRQYISDLRWLLHIWEKEGYAKAYSMFYPKYKKEKGYIKKGEPVMENVIGGKLNYLRMVKGENNPAYLRLQERYNKLQQLVFVDNETDDKQSYIYVQPYKMDEFKEYFSTSITLTVSSSGKLIGKCSLAGMDKILPISLSTQKVLCPDLEKKNVGDIVLSDKLKKCFVTLCRSKGKNFWLITRLQLKRSKCLSVQHANINIDKLLSLWDVCGLEAAVLSFQNAIMNGADIVLPEEYVISPKKFSKKVQHKTKKQLDKIVDIDESNVELQSILDSFTLDDINLDDFDNSNTIKFSL